MNLHKENSHLREALKEMNVRLNEFLAERKVKKAPDTYVNLEKQIENAQRRLNEYKHEKEIVSKQVAKLTNNDQKI